MPAELPYYRETFRRLGLDAADFRDAGALARLPVLEREAIQRDSHFRVALLAAPAGDRQATRQRVVDKLATVLGSVRIDVEFVESIDRTAGGKSAPVISRRARERRQAGG